MGLFNQDDAEDQEPNAVDFSGGRPIEPDSEDETPSPAEPSDQHDTPQGVPDDSAAIYGRSPAREEQQELSGIDSAEGGDTGLRGYAQSASETEDPYKSISPPAAVSLSPFADRTAHNQAWQSQKTAEANENVKPSVARKIAAVLLGIAEARATGDIGKAVQVGRNFNNAPRANAEARWQQAEMPLVAQGQVLDAQDIATQRANASAEQQGRINEQDYRNRIISQQDAARAKNFAAQAAAKNEGINGDGWKPDDPNNPLGGYSGTSIGGKPLHSSAPPKSVQLDPEYKIAAAAAKGTPFATEQQQILRSGGKLTFRPPPNPRQVNAEEMQWNAYVRSLGHAPTAQDVINFKRGTPGENDPETVIAKNMGAKDTFISQWTRVGKDEATKSIPEGSYVSTDGTGKIMSGPEFNARVEKFRTDLNASTPMRKSGTQVDSSGNAVSAGQPQQQAPQQQQPVVKYFQGKPYTKDAKTGQWVLQQPGR